MEKPIHHFSHNLFASDDDGKEYIFQAAYCGAHNNPRFDLGILMSPDILKANCETCQDRRHRIEKYVDPEYVGTPFYKNTGEQ